MNKYIELAKQAIEEYVKSGKVILVPTGLPQEFHSRQAGVFVTIRKGRELRGCIGTYLSTKENIAKEIIDNAISACSRDNRFYPIGKEELPGLNYEVSILSKPSPVKNIKTLDAGKNGIIVKCDDGRCGLLLPDLPGVDTVDQQIFIACQKGGINPAADGYELYSFTVEKHS
ncbi:MAG: AmmeMemoRadiSam system protein A [Candidatus Moranbacteria bacterium]|nr:AmmeMemoRadiSam system protein A [Candidatus Moranbacteria bacterium]